MRKFVKHMAPIAAMVMTGSAFAVSMGDINVISTMGEPLKAEIDLIDVSKADSAKMVGNLASPETFKDVGLNYPSHLPGLEFHVKTRSNGKYFLQVTSSQPIKDSVVDLLVEISWASGNLIREYPFTLDAAQEIKPDTAIARELRPVVPEAAGVIAKVAEIAPAAPVKKQIVFASGGSTKNVRVKAGDNLGTIAQSIQPDNVSLDRVMVAIYRANKDQFDENNMNGLKVGRILHMPNESDIAKIDKGDAVKEISVQTANWNDYQMNLSTAAKNIPEAPSQKNESVGKIVTAATVSKPPQVVEPVKPVVKLSKGEDSSNSAKASNSHGGASDESEKSLLDKQHAMEEDVIASTKALKDSMDRIAMIKKNIEELQHVIELKRQQAAATKTAFNVTPLSSAFAQPEITVTPLPPDPVPQPVSAVTQSTVQPIMIKAAPEQSSFSDLLDFKFINMQFLSSIGSAVAVIVGLIFFMSRRKRMRRYTSNQTQYELANNLRKK